MNDRASIAAKVVALYQAGRGAEARRALDAALAARPDDAELLHLRGGMLFQSGDVAGAVAALARAVALEPNRATWQVNWGVALKTLGRHVEAISAYRAAIALEPRNVDAHDYLGNALREIGHLAEGIAEHRTALALDPDRAAALNNLASGHFAQGELDEALPLFRRALELRPDFAEAHSNLIFALDFDPHIGTAEQQAERARWWERHGRRHAGAILAHANERDPGRRLRVGYVSADFLGHSAAALFAPVVTGHDPVAVEVVCYANAPREDAMTATFKARAKLWRNVYGLSDDVMAAQVRADVVDILVDLSGHSAGNRLAVFARKPAPIQVTAWGHGTGTGLKTIDALFADPVTVPQAERRFFAERVVDLPASLTFAPAPYAPEIADLPARREGVVTFGSLNRMAKTADDNLALWAKIANAAGGARLLLKDRVFDDAAQRSRVEGFFARAGVAENRLNLLGGSSHRDHLAAYGRIDIGLDPFPHGGGVSTLEALWMGVPVVTLIGRTIAGRFSAAMQTAIGLGDFAVGDLDGYLARAVAVARDLDRLAELRVALRRRVAASPVGNAKRYVGAVEEAYRDLWTRWCAGLA